MSRSSGHQSGSNISSVRSFPSNYSIAEIQDHHIELYSKYKNEKDVRSLQNDHLRDPIREHHVMESIERRFLDCKDPALIEDYVIQKLPQELDPTILRVEENRMKEQLAVVSRRVTDLMTKHQAAYFNELQLVIQLQHTVNDCINTTAEARSHLDSVRQRLGVKCLKIVNDSRRKQNLILFLEELTQRKRRMEEKNLQLELFNSNNRPDGDDDDKFLTPESEIPVKEFTETVTGSPAVIAVPDLD